MTNVSEAARKVADELFVLFDKDKNGFLTVKELKKGLRCASGRNPTKADLKKILNDMKIAKGQTISKEEFTMTIDKYYKDSKPKTKAEVEKELTDAFRVFDRNNNGFVERKELEMALKGIGETMTEAEVKQMFTAADANKDGKICYKEFVKMFTEDIKGK